MIDSSIVAGNVSPYAPEVVLGLGTAKALITYSAVGGIGGMTFAPGSVGNLPSAANLLLGPLADNGGPTMTHALLAGSTAIDAGANPAGLLNDQRGFGFARTAGAGTDIGAYEYIAAGTPIATAGPLPDVTRRGGTAYDFTVTFRDDVAIRVASLGNGDVRVTGSNGFSASPEFLGVDLNSDGTPRTATYRLTPPGGFWDVADSGDYAIDLLANQIADTAGNFAPAVRLGQISAAPPVAVAEVRVNDGSAQRSRVTSLTVMFDGAIRFLGTPADTFRIRRSDGTDVGLVATLGVVSGRYAVTLTFTGPGLEGGSLPDGNYTLIVFGATARIGPTGPLLDADGDGLPGGDGTLQFHRLFGDVNGDQAVNGLDLVAFRGAFGTTDGSPGYLDYLDFDSDGAINGTELGAYRSRFGVILP